MKLPDITNVRKVPDCGVGLRSGDFGLALKYRPVVATIWQRVQTSHSVACVNALLDTF